MSKSRKRRLSRASTVESLEARVVLTGFTAFNAFYDGPNASAFTTNFADAAGKDAAGQLLNIETGEATSVRLTANNAGARIGGNGTAPAEGTDADVFFSGRVDFTSFERNTIEVFPNDSYEYNFENLDVGAKYSFAGTAVRGNSGYTNRWTLVTLEGASSFEAVHSDNESIYGAGLNANQIALWSGDNSSSAQGGVVRWNDIDPGPDGEFQIVSSQYTGRVRGGLANGSKGYALSAIALTEQEPEGPPELVNTPATDVLGTSAQIGGRVTVSGGQVPNVTIYYGMADGETIANAWQNSIQVDPAIDFTEFVDGLVENTTYFFRSFGEHGSGAAWAPQSSSFTTLLSGPPAISNSQPLETGALSATIAGVVTDTGNDVPVVTLYYGDNDGGDDPAAWDHAVELGTQAGEFSAPIQNLDQNTEYFYTTRAQNGKGTSWAGSSVGFTTLDVPQLLINEFSADNSTLLQTRVRATAETSFLGDRLTPDWIEIRNTESSTFDLSGYFLTDDLGAANKWQFPVGTSVPANGYLVVFASGFNILDPNLDEQGNLHTSFKLDTLADAVLGIANPDGQIVVSLESIPNQQEDVTYGVGANGEGRFFSRATPGANNAVELPPAPAFSVASRTFTTSFTVQLTAALSSHTIRYTTNETKPNSASPIYTGPITINRDTMLRAISIGPNGDQSIIVAQSYVQLSASVARSESHLPLLVIETFGDSIPGGSSFGDSFIGIIEPGDDGVATLSDEFSVATRAGIHVRGSSSSGFSKKQFRVEFRDELDEDNALEVLGMPKEADWIFYGPSQYDRVLISNPLMYDLSNQIQRYATRTRWVEAYMDGRYHGVYAIIETIERDGDRVDVEKLSTGAGGVAVDGGFIWKNDRGSAYVDPEQITTAQRRYIDGHIDDLIDAAGGSSFKDPDNGYAKYADVDSFIDHNILNLLAMNVDALRLSSFYYKTADGKLQAGPIWDFDRSLDSTDGRDNNPRTWFGTGDSTRYFNDSSRVMSWWSDMAQDPDYIQRYIDRWTELRQNEFSLVNLNATIDKHAAELGDAADRDYSRWSGSRYGNFAGEINHLKDWLQDRVQWIDSRWLPIPESNVTEDRVPAGTSVTLSSTRGAVYFMLDGSDPRDEQGAIRAGATRADQPVAIGETTQLVARVLDRSFGGSNGYVRSGDDWSAPLEISAIRTAATADNLAISEIHFNPAAADVVAGEKNEDNDEFEFLEVTNTSNDAVQLDGVRLVEADVDGDSQGIEFVFADQLLPAGQSIVVVEDVDAFRSRYGDAIRIAAGEHEPGDAQGQYGGKLSNGGERLTLLAADDSIIRQFDYDDWYDSTDGNGRSLVNQDITVQDSAPLSTQAAWSASQAVHGSPGAHSPVEGDFNGSGVATVADLDLLYAALGTADSQFDLTGDNSIDLADVNYFVEVLAKSVAGDTDLDGTVAFSDFLVISVNFGQQVNGWSQGDFNSDGTVDFSDFLAISTNFGFARSAATALTADQLIGRSASLDDAEEEM